MNKKIILIGNGNYADTIRYYIENITDWDLVAYADEFVEGKHATHKGLPFVNVTYLPELYPNNEYEVVLGVGYHNMNSNRKRIYEKMKAMGYRMPNLIHPTVILNNTKMGDANVIMSNCVFEPNAEMGSDIIIWDAVLIGHNTFIGDHSHFAAVSMIAGNCKVGESCFLGNHATVKDGGVLADYTLVGAGAYVSKDTMPYDVVVPARSVTLKNHKSTDFI